MSTVQLNFVRCVELQYLYCTLYSVHLKERRTWQCKARGMEPRGYCWLTNSALVYEPNAGGGGELRGLSQ
jgi:hypothetical protein